MAQFSTFQAAPDGFIVSAMTRTRHIITARDAQNSARFGVSLRGLLLLTLR